MATKKSPKNTAPVDENALRNVGEQLVAEKKKRTRKDLSEKQSVHTNPGDNAKYIRHSLRLADLPKVSMADEVQVGERVKQYFEICAEDDMKPSVVGLALALDIDRVYLWKIRAGEKGKNPAVVNILKKAMQLLDLQMNEYMAHGQINPVTGIFLMKNHFGYADKQEVVVTPQSPLGEIKDTKALEDQYKDSIVVEAEVIDD